ncbi:hypothetical protein [Deinococcus aluminii]|uniref:Type II secretion system protein GspE N-terminal domain-containing protein n=1 Tax=Deinococcus aluminii TaxID=1656885 RepID=A0ABP9XHB0_9DEIO
MNFDLQTLHALGFLSQAQSAAARSLLEQGGGTPLGAVATVLGEQAAHLWGQMARELGWPFYPDHKALKSLEGHLLDHRAALRLGVLPHRRQYTHLHVLTHDPGVRAEELPELGSHVALELVPPDVYRRVYALLYPRLPFERFDEAEALAIATGRGGRLFAGGSIAQWRARRLITEAQAAEAQAILNGFEYANPEVSAPDPSTLSLLPVDTMVMLRAYPYRLVGGRLQVLMSEPNDRAVRTLELTTQRRVEPVMTARASLDLLLSATPETQATITALAEMIGALGPVPTELEPTIVGE